MKTRFSANGIESNVARPGCDLPTALYFGKLDVAAATDYLYISLNFLEAVTSPEPDVKFAGP